MRRPALWLVYSFVGVGFLVTGRFVFFVCLLVTPAQKKKKVIYGMEDRMICFKASNKVKAYQNSMFCILRKYHRSICNLISGSQITESSSHPLRAFVLWKLLRVQLHVYNLKNVEGVAIQQRSMSPKLAPKNKRICNSKKE